MIFILFFRLVAAIEDLGGNPYLSALITELKHLYTQSETSEETSNPKPENM